MAGADDDVEDVITNYFAQFVSVTDPDDLSSEDWRPDAAGLLRWLAQHGWQISRR